MSVSRLGSDFGGRSPGPSGRKATHPPPHCPPGFASSILHRAPNGVRGPGPRLHTLQTPRAIEPRPAVYLTVIRRSVGFPPITAAPIPAATHVRLRHRVHPIAPAVQLGRGSGAEHEQGEGKERDQDHGCSSETDGGCGRHGWGLPGDRTFSPFATGTNQPEKSLHVFAKNFSNPDRTRTGTG